MASQFGRTYEANNDIMATYLNIIQDKARYYQLEVFLKPKNNLRHAEAYLAATLTGKSFWKIDIIIYCCLKAWHFKAIEDSKGSPQLYK